MKKPHLPSLFNIFKIGREERPVALTALLLFAALNMLVVCHYYNLFTPMTDRYWQLFVRNFHISGYDPITYSVVSDWIAGFNVFRHPLLAFYLYIPYLINQLLMSLTGINCAIFIIAITQVTIGIYSAVFFFRICREIVGTGRNDALLLTAFFFSFAYIMLAAMVPDHFLFSMLLLLIALYIAGRRMQKGRTFKAWQTIVYFLLTAGTTLTGGLKIFMAALFTNGKRFFRPTYLLLAVIVPAVAIWSFSRWEYHKLVWPREVALHKEKAKQKKEQIEKERKQARLDSIAVARGEKTPEQVKKRKVKKVLKQGKPISNGEFMRWTDITTSRSKSLVENFFGESLQLHQDYLLQDVLLKRPIIVKYRHLYNYVVEAIIVLLFIIGIWCGRHSRFLWLAIAFFMLDVVLHLGLGFGINEVYIMTPHWAYVLPITTAFFLKKTGKLAHYCLCILVLSLTLWLYAWNISQIVSYLI